MRVYVGRMLAVIAFAAGATLLLRGGFAMPSFADSFAPDLALVLLLVVAVLAVARARNFVTGIVAAGMVGFIVALVYLFQGAPDLAFTQFSVEALAIIIFLAIVGRLPFREEDYRTRPERLRDMGVAAGTGVAATLVFASVPEAHGRNLVNVIIVDFRALDTLGEITVLGLAAIAAAAVITGLRRRAKEDRP
jgi:multicomponent Na+:H+ antiporter subunit A